MRPGKVSEVLVVPPLYFDVVDSYNTRMRPDHPFGKPDRKKAMAQWSLMVDALHQMGIKTMEVAPREKLYDMAFACDPGLWIDDLFVAGTFQIPERRPETEIFEDLFALNGHEVIRMPDGAYFEGGDCVMVGNVAVIGYGESRTNEAGIRFLTEELGKRGVEVVPIRRVTEEFYHLNSVLTYYPTAHTLAWYPAAFEMATWKKLQAAVPGARLLTLGRDEVNRNHPAFGGEDLYSYCLNSIENNGKVLMPYCFSGYRDDLKKCGLEIIVPEGGSSEFERSGGSYRCLTMIHNITK